MEFPRQIIQFGKHQLHYQVFGTGKKLLLAFHGFGRNANDFRSFEKHIGDTYTIVSFDLFYHGANTNYSAESNISKEEIGTLIPECLRQFNVESCSIIAYSIGGRIAMVLLEKQSKYIDELFLLAPDGLKFNLVHWFAIRTSIGRNLFKLTLQNPKPVFFIARMLHQLKIINKQTYQFGMYHLEDPGMRQLVFNVWYMLRNISPDQSKIKRNISNKNRIEFFFGNKDPIIKPVFHTRIKFKSSIHFLDCGHNLFNKVVEISEVIQRNQPQ